MKCICGLTVSIFVEMIKFVVIGSIIHSVDAKIMTS